MAAVDVIVFTRPTCPYCVKAKELLLTKSNVNVFQIVLDHQKSYDEARAAMIEMSGGKTTVPQIFVQGEFVPGGFTGLKQLDDAGELDKLLERKGQPDLENVEFPPANLNFIKERIERTPVVKIEQLDF